MPLEAVWTTWAVKNGVSAAVSDTVFGKGRLGDIRQKSFKTGMGTVDLLMHYTDEGFIWDAGLFQPQLHGQAFLPYLDFIHAAERIAFAVYMGDVQYARAVVNTAEVALKYGVGDPNDKVGGLFSALKGYNNTVTISGINFSEGSFTATYSCRTAKGALDFAVSFKPTANLFLNGQIQLLQEQMIRNLKNKATGFSNPKERPWSPYVSVSPEARNLKLSFPEFKPYENDLTYRKLPESKTWEAELPENYTRTDAGIEIALRNFWTSLYLPDSISGFQTKAPEKISIKSAGRHESADVVMDLDRWKNWIRSIDPAILPVYYGPMQALKPEENRYIAVGSWSVIDPLLNIEHLFKVTTNLQATETGLSIVEASIVATFCVRLDNVDRLHARETKSNGTSALPPFKIDLKNKQKKQQ